MSAAVPQEPTETGRRYRGLTAEERRAARRQRLLDVGLGTFGTIGYGATTIEQLCSDAGVTPRHFYQEFPSREALLLAVYDDSVRRTDESARAAVAAAPPELRARTRAGIDAFVHAMCDDPRRARVLCVEAVGVSPEFERHRRQVVHAFAELTEAESRRLAKELGNPPRDSRIRSMALVGAVHELVIEWALSADRPPLEDMIDELTEFWIAVRQVP